MIYNKIIMNIQASQLNLDLRELPLNMHEIFLETV